MPTEILQQLLRSRLALLATLGGLTGLVAAAVVRLIPWGLFFLTLLLGIVGTLVYAFVRQWWARRKDEAFERGLDAQGLRAIGHARVRDRENVKALQARWKEQVEALRRSRIGKQKRWLYFLPWYAIIGAPASGKTTAIGNSGLRFPMGQPKLAGTGGTKNCDWFFAEEAIIIDTAGRYTFGDENEPDRDEWLEFLKLLRRYRPVAPINGLIIAVSADSLLADGGEQVSEHARVMRHKLDELVRELGIQFPVYVFVTKCDLIEGFTEFFGRLPRRRLDEMLGWTNPSWEMHDAKKLVAEALAGLHARVAAMRPGFLWEEERPEALRAVYLFPEEIRAFAKNLEEFCDVLFRENQYNESPFLRGIYLTSGLQKGTAVSRMLDRLGLRAQATELREERRSYFLKDFFQIRLPADRNLVATTGRSRGRLQVVHNVGLTAVATAAILFAVLTGGSYVANRTLLNDLEDEMRAASATEGAPADTVGALARYVDVLDRLEDRNRRRPTSAGWGLWTGYRAIEPARSLFLARFEREAYLPGVDTARRLLRARDPERGFAALEALVRNYVLSKMLNGGHQEAPGANDALAVFWANGAETPEPLLEAYARGYLAYLRWRPAETARAEQANDLVLVREALPELFTVERVAAWADRLYPPLRAVEIPTPAAVANGAAVRGAFRPEAWSERIAPLADAVDEVAPEIDPQLTPRFREGYRRAYHREWLQFLMQPRVGGDGQTPLPTLLGEQTPYLAIVERTAAALAAFEGDAADAPAWTRTLARVSGERSAYLAQLTAVDRHVRAGRSDPPAALEDAKTVFTRRVAVAADDGVDPPPDPFGKAERWVANLAQAGSAADETDAQVRGRVQEMLADPVYEAFRDYLGIVAQEIDTQWRLRVGRMPAESWEDVRALYMTGGVVPEFVNAVLAPFFETGGFQHKVRYRGKLPRNMDWLPPTLDKIRRRGGGGSGGGAGGQDKLFFTAVPSVPGSDGLFATRTTLTVWCGDEPWRLEHRNFPASRQLTWSAQTCSRAEVAVSVGQGPGDERPLDPRAAESLPGLIRQAEELGSGTVGWRFPGGVTARFKVTLPPGFLEGTAGLRPPPQLPKS